MTTPATKCRHTDVQDFDDFRCCLSSGELLTETNPRSLLTTTPPLYKYEILEQEAGQHIRFVHIRLGQEQDDITCEITLPSLRVRGQHLDTIIESHFSAVDTQPSTAIQTRLNFRAEVKAIELRAEVEAVYLRVEEEVTDLWKRYMNEKGALGTRQTQTPLFKYPFCHACVTLDSTNAHTKRESAALRYEIRELAEFDHVASQIEGNKELFVTKQSMGFTHALRLDIGRQPGPMRHWDRMPSVGDTIWAVAGVDVPLILRRIDQHYVMIGHCYLHRALLGRECPSCGLTYKPWSTNPEIIDIW
jgi:hypothetical protein